MGSERLVISTHEVEECLPDAGALPFLLQAEPELPDYVRSENSQGDSTAGRNCYIDFVQRSMAHPVQVFLQALQGVKPECAVLLLGPVSG